MTTTAVLLFHPHLDASRVNARLAQAARSAGTPERPLEVRDMYGLYPDFRIDVAAEHAVLEACDRIVLQFPMYWYSSPALLKQWQDDVLTYGWAYGSTGRALAGKELLVAVSTGADSYGRGDSYSVNELLLPFQATADLCHLTYLEPFATTGALSIPDEALAARAREYATVLTAPRPVAR